MEPAEAQRAVAAGRSVASALGLQVEGADVVHNSNRIAVRLTPCDVLARIAPPGRSWQASAEFELDVVRRLAAAGSPVAEPEPRVAPRVYVRDGFAITLWTYYEPVGPSTITPAEYAQALSWLHAGLRQVEARAPHFTDRVAEAEGLVADREQTPGLPDADRELLGNSLRRLSTGIIGSGAGEQLLHGEPHLGNLLRTRAGLLFVDFETCCRGPVEFDLAHGFLPSADGQMVAGEEVCEHYPGADQGLVDHCGSLIWAMITTWRWQRDDQLPNGRFWAVEGLNQLRAARDR